MKEVARSNLSTEHGSSAPSKTPEHLGKPWEISAARENVCHSPKKAISSGHVALVRQLFERPRRSAQTQQKSGVQKTESHDNGGNCSELHSLGSLPNEAVQVNDLKLSPRKQKEMRLDTDADQMACEGEEQSGDEEEEPIEYLLLELIPHLPSETAKDLLLALQKSEAEGQRMRKVIQELSKTASVAEACDDEVYNFNGGKPARPGTRLSMTSFIVGALALCLTGYMLWALRANDSMMSCCNVNDNAYESPVKRGSEAVIDDVGSSKKRHKLKQDITSARATNGACWRKLQVEQGQYAARSKSSETCAVAGTGASTASALNSAGSFTQALVLKDFVEEQRRQLANLSSQADRLQEEITICTRCLAAHDISSSC